MGLDLKFEALIKSQAKYESPNLGLNLLITRLQRKYSNNPTPAELSNCVQEMKAFLKDTLHCGEDVEALKNYRGKKYVC